MVPRWVVAAAGVRARAQASNLSFVEIGPEIAAKVLVLSCEASMRVEWK